MNNKIVLCLLSFILSTPSFGWGKTGHRVVGLIAEQNLTPKAKKQIAKILKHENLAIAANWPDEIKSDPSVGSFNSWHYVTIENGKKYSDITLNPLGNIYDAIDKLTAKLSDKKSSNEDKIFAIRLLTHLVGDFHQPFHVGKEEDRGGTSIKVNWFGKETNLHSIWDDEIIDNQRYSYTEYASILKTKFEHKKKNYLSVDKNIWINEDMEYRPLMYSVTQYRTEIVKENKKSEEWKKYWEYEYMYKVVPVIEEQLFKGGIRLAQILNQALK